MWVLGTELPTNWLESILCGAIAPVGDVVITWNESNGFAFQILHEQV